LEQVVLPRACFEQRTAANYQFAIQQIANLRYDEMPGKGEK
jgi:hypothetical protein